jgi:hypothetical protein
LLGLLDECRKHGRLNIENRRRAHQQRLGNCRFKRVRRRSLVRIGLLAGNELFNLGQPFFHGTLRSDSRLGLLLNFINLSDDFGALTLRSNTGIRVSQKIVELIKFLK